MTTAGRADDEGGPAKDPAGPSWSVRRLDPVRDMAAVTTLSLACADYALMVNGEPPGEADGPGFFADAAPGKSQADMLKLGIEASHGDLVGVADIVRGYPDDLSWYIGLLLLHPTARGRGVGRTAVRHVEVEARGDGAARLMLSGVEENAAALGFWRHLGFEDVRRLAPRRFGSKEHVRIEMGRWLRRA